MSCKKPHFLNLTVQNVLGGFVECYDANNYSGIIYLANGESGTVTSSPVGNSGPSIGCGDDGIYTSTVIINSITLIPPLPSPGPLTSAVLDPSLWSSTGSSPAGSSTLWSYTYPGNNGTASVGFNVVSPVAPTFSSQGVVVDLPPYTGATNEAAAFGFDPGGGSMTMTLTANTTAGLSCLANVDYIYDFVPVTSLPITITTPLNTDPGVNTVCQNTGSSDIQLTITNITYNFEGPSPFPSPSPSPSVALSVSTPQISQQGAGMGTDGRFGVAPNLAFEVDVPVTGTNFNSITNQTTLVTLQAGSQALQTQSLSLSDLQNAGGSSVVTFYVTFDASLENTTQTLTATVDPQDVFNETTSSASVNVDVVSCGALISNSVTSPSGIGTPEITTTFIPQYHYSLTAAAAVCGYTAFDWQQEIVSLPLPNPFFQVGYSQELSAPPAFLDPPSGGYTYELTLTDKTGALLYPTGDDAYPFYWGVNNGDLRNATLTGILKFQDDPTNPCLPGGTGNGCGGKTAPVGSRMAFYTSLVGVNPDGSPAITGIGFSWYSTFNGTSGGIATTKNINPPDPGSGTGGVTVTSIQEVATFTAPYSGANAPQQLTSDNNCNGVYTGTYNGNINVSNGQTCTIENAVITGSIQMTGGILVLSGDLINGTVNAQNGGIITVNNYTRVTGNFQISNLPSVNNALNQVCDSTFNGDVQIQNNKAPVQIGSGSSVTCGGNQISGDLQVQNNTGSTSIYNNAIGSSFQNQNNAGSTAIFNNIVTGTLQCQNNAQISGGNNTETQNQCSGI